jgi:hypothetical protein
MILTWHFLATIIIIACTKDVLGALRVVGLQWSGVDILRTPFYRRTFKNDYGFEPVIFGWELVLLNVWVIVCFFFTLNPWLLAIGVMFTAAQEMISRRWRPGEPVTVIAGLKAVKIVSCAWLIAGYVHRELGLIPYFLR